MKTYTAPDGITWKVVVQAPAASNSMILFRHPDGNSSRLDRYNWIINQGPEARSVTARVVPAKVLERLEPAEIAKLFARSMPVSRQHSFNEAPEPVRG